MLCWDPTHQFCSFKAANLIFGSFSSFFKNGRSNSLLANLWIWIYSATKKLWWFSLRNHLYWIFLLGSTDFRSLLHECLQLFHPFSVIVKFKRYFALLCRIFFFTLLCWLHFSLPFYVEFWTEEIYLGKVTSFVNYRPMTKLFDVVKERCKSVLTNSTKVLHRNWLKYLYLLNRFWGF